MELKTLLFEKPGKENTEATLAVVRERAQALGVKQVVVASSHGFTARKAHTLLAPLGIQVIAVTISHGWESEGWCMTAEERAALRKLGVIVHTGIHALGDGVGSAFSEKRGGRRRRDRARDALSLLPGHESGGRVCADGRRRRAAQLDQEIISVAGTDSGADTAIVCRPACPRAFHQLRISWQSAPSRAAVFDKTALSGNIRGGRARRGASGALYPQSAIAGSNSLSEVSILGDCSQQCGVEDWVLRGEGL